MKTAMGNCRDLKRPAGFVKAGIPQERPAADGDDDWTASTQVGPTHELTPAQF